MQFIENTVQRNTLPFSDIKLDSSNETTKPCLEANLSTTTLMEGDVSAPCMSGRSDNQLVDSSITCLTTGDSFNDIEEDVSVSTSLKTVDPATLVQKDDEKLFRHGISRYAPYGTRFAAEMRDGTYQTSHIAGDLANRARSKTGKGGRVDLSLVTHAGEREQLDSALKYFDSVAFVKPGPSEVLNHLRSLDIDWDYRKGDGIKLLQRNASNFFKRMMEHAKRVSHPLSETFLFQSPISNSSTSPTSSNRIQVDAQVRKAASILSGMMSFPDMSPTKQLYIDEEEGDEMSVDSDNSEFDEIEMVSRQDSLQSSSIGSSIGTLVDPLPKPKRQNVEDEARETDWTRPNHLKGSFFYEIARHARISMQEEREYYSKAAEKFDWSTVESITACYIPNPPVPEGRNYCESDDEVKEVHVPKRQKIRVAPYQRPPKPQPNLRPFVSQGSVPSTALPMVRKTPDGIATSIHLKGLSRHSPYGTRFCAQMPNGEMRESYLAGDLADRVRTGKGHGELLLVLHDGEIQQLSTAWEFLVVQNSSQIGAGQVLDYLRDLNLDENHRKPGSRLLQKNAGNFFKRVQEYGRRKMADPSYLELKSFAE
jgi:hypothetical protein